MLLLNEQIIKNVTKSDTEFIPVLLLYISIKEYIILSSNPKAYLCLVSQHFLFLVNFLRCPRYSETTIWEAKNTRMFWKVPRFCLIPKVLSMLPLRLLFLFNFNCIVNTLSLYTNWGMLISIIKIIHVLCNLITLRSHC